MRVCSSHLHQNRAMLRALIEYYMMRVRVFVRVLPLLLLGALGDRLIVSGNLKQYIQTKGIVSHFADHIVHLAIPFTLIDKTKHLNYNIHRTSTLLGRHDVKSK